jgi:hypothetical protein
MRICPTTFGERAVQRLIFFNETGRRTELLVCIGDVDVQIFGSKLQMMIQ